MHDLTEKFRVTRSHRVLQTLLEISRELDGKRELSIYWSVSHMLSCVQIIRLLALKRGLDADFASISAALHDIASFMTGSHDDHAAKAAPYIDEFIQKHNLSAPKYCISEDESKNLKDIIAIHSEKDTDSGDPYAELLKDADALDRYLHGIVTKPHSAKASKSLGRMRLHAHLIFSGR